MIFRPLLALVLTLSTFTTAYRPTQFCKHRGENGKAEMCFAINHYYNITTQSTDVYITLNTWRFKSSSIGWAAMGLGQRMLGALMFIIYGDPTSGYMTTVIRSANGHHPPLGITDPSVYSGAIPEIEIRTSEFRPYTGEYVNEKLDLKPTHIGVMEAVCYSCAVWEGFAIHNDTLAQQMIWSTNSLQDWSGDFGPDRTVEMHSFGLGFGFLWTDMLNAAVSTPFFPSVDEMTKPGITGMYEYGDPPAPTEDELAAGKKIEDAAAHDTVEDVEGTSTSAVTAETASIPTAASATSTPPEPTTSIAAPLPTTTPTTSTTSETSNDDSVLYPAPTFRGKSIREWMFLLHGLLMSLSFLVLYPLGASLLRTPRPTAFNLHWTIQSLGSVCLAIGAGIGYFQSHSISVLHQYLGLAIVLAVATQLGLGAWHHAAFLRVKRPTWMGFVHVHLGRTVLTAGLVNLVMGVLLARYSRLIIAAVVVADMILLVALTYFLGRHTVRQLSGEGYTGANVKTRVRQPLGQVAEEYFQLTGEEEEEEEEEEDGDGWSDDDAGRGIADVGGLGGEQERIKKEEQARRLARLDKV